MRILIEKLFEFPAKAHEFLMKALSSRQAKV